MYVIFYFRCWHWETKYVMKKVTNPFILIFPQMETAPRTARSPPPPRSTGTPSRGTANLPDAAGQGTQRWITAATVMIPFVHSRLVAGG